MLVTVILSENTQSVELYQVTLLLAQAEMNVVQGNST